MSKTTTTLPTSLRELRKDKGLTLQEVANGLTQRGIYADAAPSHVAHLETRGTKNILIIKALAEIYDTTTDSLIPLCA